MSLGGFSRRNRSWWCDRCGDHVAEAADPLAGPLMVEHRASCTGHRERQVGSNGWWMSLGR